ncbi:PREDICTED: pheromone-binding protein Gp-9-like [Wasmannia auropunctata]|uniref:pheromone-binding protein Gp-9-like n=1 Tax=Wasmannia auropunctata TaxID=64793 RepID=UPI0005EF8319|nr:PREDICTED: pheromone-binding protein Gp-9-like [Wasmannia auropunctata]
MKAFELCICALACISLASSVSIVSQLGKQSNNNNQFVNACITEVGMSYDDDFDVRDIINDSIDTPELEEKTRKHGCFIECVLRKLNWMEGSELKEEKLYADINKAFTNHPLQTQIQEFISDCATKVKNANQEGCQRGVVAMKCGVKGVNRLFPFAMNADEEIEENAENENN